MRTDAEVTAYCHALASARSADERDVALDAIVLFLRDSATDARRVVARGRSRLLASACETRTSARRVRDLETPRLEAPEPGT